MHKRSIDLHVVYYEKKGNVLFFQVHFFPTFFRVDKRKSNLLKVTQVKSALSFLERVLHFQLHALARPLLVHSRLFAPPLLLLPRLNTWCFNQQ